MRSQREDLLLGLSSEQRVKDTLSSAFNDTLKKTTTFHPMDYEGCGCWIEIKTRPNCTVNTYPTFMLSYNKIQFADKSDRPVYIVYVLKDAIYYIQYEKELFSTFEVSSFQRTGRCDANDLSQSVIYIPTKELKKLQ